MARDLLLSDDDLATLTYFLKEKDATSWCDWESKKHLVQNDYPALYQAIVNLQLAELTLAAIVKGM